MKIAALAMLAAALLVGCSSEDEPTTPTSTPSQAPAETADPYDAYLENAPEGEPVLTPEDAQTRALLGCGMEWAPGTVDAVLAEAYADLCP